MLCVAAGKSVALFHLDSTPENPKSATQYAHCAAVCAIIAHLAARLHCPQPLSSQGSAGAAQCKKAFPPPFVQQCAPPNHLTAFFSSRIYAPVTTPVSTSSGPQHRYRQRRTDPPVDRIAPRSKIQYFSRSLPSQLGAFDWTSVYAPPPPETPPCVVPWPPTPRVLFSVLRPRHSTIASPRQAPLFARWRRHSW